MLSRSNANYVTPIGTAAAFRLTYIASADSGGKQLRFLHDKRKGRRQQMRRWATMRQIILYGGRESDETAD